VGFFVKEIMMSFAVKKMTLADERMVYSEQNIPFIRKFGGIHLSTAPIATCNWIVNEDQSIYMLRIRNFEVREHQVRFLLFFNGEFAVYEGDSDSKLSITLTRLHIAPALQSRLPGRVESAMRIVGRTV
jgi:hypothetical protein